ncbi:MAG: helix-turn-helix transcriptional regulator [Desulfuromonadales bacterium]|nr:helix-turn-helix transcriptional regulator [Desulfuromonadales bacterium]
MTVKSRIDEAFRYFNLPPKAGFAAVAQAYRELKLLYSTDGLATYSLLNKEGRLRELAEIEEFYLVLTEHLTDKNQAEPAGPRGDARHWDCGSGVSPAAFLRECREIDGVSLQSIAVKSKIGTDHLTNIEMQRDERLPAPVYLRGFIIEFARQLRISNPEELASAYLHLLADRKGG